MLRQWSKPARGRIEAQRVLAWTSAADEAAPDIDVGISVAENILPAEDYAPLANALSDALAQLASITGRMPARLALEIADFHVHYDVFDADVRSVAPLQASELAAHALEDALGMPAGRLVVRTSVQGRGRSLAACGMPAALLDALQLACERRGVALTNVRPAFASFLDRHANSISAGDAVFARQSGAELMLALRHRGDWRGFSRERMRATDWREFENLCAAFCLRLGAPDAARIPVWFDADLAGDLPGSERQWHCLPGRSQ